MGLSNDEVENIRRGALLHDIGKLGVPDRILLKNGPLTEDEWTVMKRHPQLAYRFLAKVPYLEKSLDIPRFHHERWDGNGYPSGLSGTRIPLAARLFAVVDVYTHSQASDLIGTHGPKQRPRNVCASRRAFSSTQRLSMFFCSCLRHLRKHTTKSDCPLN